MSTLLNAAVIFVTCLAFLLLVRMDDKANLPREERHRQFLMPFIAIVYAVLLLVFFQPIYGSLSSLLGFAPQKTSMSLECLVVCVFNFVALLVFVGVKRAAFTFLNHSSEAGREAFLAPLYRIAYFYDEGESKWLLNSRYMELRRAVKWTHWAAVVISLVLLVLSIKFSTRSVFSTPFYPVFLVLIIGEIRYFFEGLSKDEYLSACAVETDDFERVRDYMMLQKDAARTFPHRFMESHLKASPRSKWISSREYIDELRASDDYEERLAGTYVNAVYEAMGEWFSSNAGEESNNLFDEADFEETFHIQIDQIQTMVKLLKGNNVIFATPFYRDFREFFFFPVNRVLMRGGKVLVIDGQGDMGASVEEWVESGLHTASSVSGLWKVGRLHKESDPEKLDVGVVPFYHINDLDFLDVSRGFLEKVGFVILLHPSNMISVTQIGFSLLTQILPDSEHVTYAAFDVNADGLVDSLSHAVRDQFVEVSAMQDVSLLNCGIHWRAEGTEEYRDIFDNVSHYLGVGTQIAAHSLGMGVERVHWAAHRSVPLKDVRWLAGQYYQSITGYSGIDRSQEALENAMRIDCNLWDAPLELDCCHIAEDELCNLLEMQRQYSTRGVQSSFVHVLSGNYLLRDFMRYNTRVLLRDSRVLSLTVADFERSLRNYLIELEVRLLHEGRIEAEETCARLRVMGMGLEPFELFDYLRDMFDYYSLLDAKLFERCFEFVPDVSIEDRVLGKDVLRSFVAIREQVWRERSRALAGERGEDITEDIGLELFNELVDSSRYLRYAHYISEDEYEEDRQLGSCLFGQIQQRYLPGQFLTIAGKYYEVISITEDSGMLLRRAGDHFGRRLQYRQVKHIELANCNDSQEAEKKRASLPGWVERSEAPRRRRFIRKGDAEVEIALLAADITIHTDGYLRMVDLADIEGSAFTSVDEDSVMPRFYHQKNVLRLTLKGATDRQLVTIAALMNELSRTMYACDHEYLMAVPVLETPIADYTEQGLRGVVAPVKADATVRASAIYIIEDSMVDIGLVSSFERNAERFLSIIERFLTWHATMIASGPISDPDAEHFVSPEDVLGDPDRYIGDSRMNELVPTGSTSFDLSPDEFALDSDSAAMVVDDPEFEFSSEDDSELGEDE